MRGSLTNKAQVLEVLRAGGKVHHLGSMVSLSDAAGTPVDAWQTAIKSAEKAYAAEVQRDDDPIWQTLQLAVEIADSAARADIECECLQVDPGDGSSWYDTAAVPRDAHQKDQAFLRAIIARADRYLTLRGEGAQDYLIIRNPAFPHLVRFEARP